LTDLSLSSKTTSRIPALEILASTICLQESNEISFTVRGVAVDFGVNVGSMVAVRGSVLVAASLGDGVTTLCGTQAARSVIKIKNKREYFFVADSYYMLSLNFTKVKNPQRS